MIAGKLLTSSPHLTTNVMKKIFVFIALSLVVVTVWAQKKRTQTVTSTAQQEVEMIKAVIVKETKSFFETNKAGWMDCWVQAPHAYWSFADSSDVNFYKGWTSIEKGFADYFAMSKPASVKIDNTWDEIKVYGAGAFVLFRQKISGDGIERDEQSEVRILEKDVNGAWRIAHVGVIRKPKE
jgi:hypothetical protein